MESIGLAETAADIAYVEAGYVTFDRLDRGLGEAAWPGTRMPRETYRTSDGRRWFARDWWRMHDDAGGVDRVRPLFERRLRAAAERLGETCDASAEWDAYIAGLYGACLRDVTPEAIVLKEHLVRRIAHDLAEARPDDPRWAARLRANVEALDGQTRAFASCDRLRFGGTTSRDRLIAGARTAYPWVFERD